LTDPAITDVLESLGLKGDVAVRARAMLDQARTLKLLGSSEHGMDESIVPQVLRLVRFPRRPSIRVGDKIVLYVLGFDRAFAIIEAFSPVRPGQGDNPWDKWFMDVREAMCVPYADSAVDRRHLCRGA
jgi:hypothetical protein